MTVLGSVKLKDSQLEVWTSSGLSRSPLYTPIILLNKYVFSVQTSARQSCQSLAINLAVSPETTQIMILRHTKYCPASGGVVFQRRTRGSPAREQTANSWVRRSDGRVRRTSGSSIAYSFIQWGSTSLRYQYLFPKIGKWQIFPSN